MMTMAISSSFASRLVLCIAPALLFLFVSSISTSYAAPIHLSPYDGRGMDANCISIRSPEAFLTPSKTSLLFSIDGYSGRSSTAVTGHGNPIDPHFERTEFIKNVLIDNIDPVVLLLGARPEKLYQLTPTALTAAYFRLLCIANRLPVEVNVYDNNVAKIQTSIQDAVTNSSTRLGNLDTTLCLPKFPISGQAQRMCAEVLDMPFIAPAEITAVSTIATTGGTFIPLDLSHVSAAIPSTNSESQNTNRPLDTPTTREDPRISPFSDIESDDDLVRFFQGMNRTQLIVHTRFTGAESSPSGEDTTNGDLITSLVNRIKSLREENVNAEVPQQPSLAASEALRSAVQATLHPVRMTDDQSGSNTGPAPRSSSDNMRIAQVVVDTNRLIIATRIVMPALFTKSVYVSVASFDNVTLQGIFAFLDAQVALYNYLIARVRAGDGGPNNNLLQRATTTLLWESMTNYMSERASGLERILGMLPIGSLAMHCILSALRTPALGLTSETYTKKWSAVDCHCGDEENFSLGELNAAIVKGFQDMTALNIPFPTPDQTFNALFTGTDAPLHTWMFSAKSITGTLHDVLTKTHTIAMSSEEATQDDVDELLSALNTHAKFQDLLAASGSKGSSNTIFATTTSSTKGASNQPCIRNLTNRTCRPGPNRSCKHGHYDEDNKAPHGILIEHKVELSKVPRPKDLSKSRCAAAGISYEGLCDILAEPRSPSTNLPNRTSRKPTWYYMWALQHAQQVQTRPLPWNCKGACPCAIPGSGSSTCGASPLACSTVRKQLELLSLDQRTPEATVALTLLRSPVPQIEQTALPVPNTSPSPFAFAVSTAAASEPIPSISPSAAAQALAEHMTPEMRQNLRDMSPDDFKKGISSVFGL